MDPGNQQSNSKKQNKCHQHFQLGSSLVINEGTSFYSISSCSNCNTDDVVPLMGFQQTPTTSTLSNLCNSPTSSDHGMCTQILNSATTSTGCQCVDAPFLGTWRNVPPVQPKVRYKIKCSASDGYTYFLEKKLMVLGWAQWFPPFYHRQRTMVLALLVVVVVVTLSVALALVEDDAACYRLGRAVKSTSFPFMFKRLPCSG